MTINPSEGNKNKRANAGDRRTFVRDASAVSPLAAAGMALPQSGDAQSRRTSIRTPLTEHFGLDYPIVLAPMGGTAGGDLAAAVSNAGGLGLVGGAFGNLASLSKELDLVKAKTKRKWGVGLITWRATEDALRLALSYKPDAFFLSFGDPAKFSRLIKAVGCTLICQVQDVASALLAREAGAEILIAQGTEAGGHGSTMRSTLPLVPAVIDATAPLPVLAAGGNR